MPAKPAVETKQLRHDALDPREVAREIAEQKRALQLLLAQIGPTPDQPVGTQALTELTRVVAGTRVAPPHLEVAPRRGAVRKALADVESAERELFLGAPPTQSQQDRQPSQAVVAQQARTRARAAVQQLFVPAKAQAQTRRTGRSSFDTERALRKAARDNAGLYQCAKGVANVLADQGLPCRRDHAREWWKHLPKLGWRRLDVSPAAAPVGAVLVFKSNPQVGKPMNRRGTGQEYGHVEVVGVDRAGKRWYISDKARSTWGGSVPGNYAGAFVYGR